MLAKKLKSKPTHFSSEDSQNTDHSMDSSLEIAESNAKYSHASKFNQLRETVNQLFLANPELAEEIKFDQDVGAAPEEAELDSPTNMSPPPTSPNKKGANDSSQGVLEETNTNTSSAKFWGAISKEMVKSQANSKIPSLNQINHILNIFKMKFEKTEQIETSFSPTKTALKKSKPDFRIQSGKGTGDKQLSARKESKSQGQNMMSPQNNTNSQEEGEDGVNYYSSRKKIHLKLKQKRIEREIEEQKKKKELEAQNEKLAKEREQKLMMYTLAELDQELKRTTTLKFDEDRPGEATSRNMMKIKPRRGSGSRKNSLKTKGDIFERLTKDLTHKNATEEEDEINMKKTFTSAFAEALYKDMKAFGDPEAFKKIAQARIMNYRKEFKEKLSKQKQLPGEGMRFVKEKSRNMNMFLPDFEKAAGVANKEAIFSKKEAQRDAEEKENPDYEVLAKFQKIRYGNILEFWQESKDLLQ